MAHPKMRADGVIESCMHVACALTALVVVYFLGTLAGDAAVAVSRYFAG